jgi:predicted nucleotidyltransferase
MRIRDPFIETRRCASTVRRPDAILEGMEPDLAHRLASVDGVVGVVLGGSRARGTHRPDSDVDLGVYYQGRLDVAALQTLADEVADEPAAVTEPGGWGPWVDGGGWLAIGGQRVDWIYRDLDRVRHVWTDCQAGRYQVSFQVGHPLGFYSHAYAGELALSRVLADPLGQLTELREQTLAYPPALGDALVAGVWEAEFAVSLARYGVAGRDPTYTAGCLFRAVGVVCQALHGQARRWLINEKGMVASAAALPLAPDGFAERAHALLSSPVDSIARAEELIAAVKAAVESTVDS